MTDRTRVSVPLPLRIGVIGAAVAFSTGAGLVAYFVSGLSLPVGIGLAFVVTGVVGVAVWRRLDGDRRASVRRRARAGLALAGPDVHLAVQVHVDHDRGAVRIRRIAGRDVEGHRNGEI